jgi:DNA transformation protein
VCYYLYSLQGALMGVHWDSVPKNVKDELFLKAKGKTRK